LAATTCCALSQTTTKIKTQRFLHRPVTGGDHGVQVVKQIKVCVGSSRQISKLPSPRPGRFCQAMPSRSSRMGAPAGLQQELSGPQPGARHSLGGQLRHSPSANNSREGFSSRGQQTKAEVIEIVTLVVSIWPLFLQNQEVELQDLIPGRNNWPQPCSLRHSHSRLAGSTYAYWWIRHKVELQLLQAAAALSS